MSKKKPHLHKSKLAYNFDADNEVAHTQKYPLQDGFKVYKTAAGYEVVYQERGAQFARKVFATKEEAEKHLKGLRNN